MSAQAFDDFLRIMRVQLDVEHIDTRKSLEENPLALQPACRPMRSFQGIEFLRYQHVRFGVKLFGFMH